MCLFGHCIYFYINDASVLYGYYVYLKFFKCFWKCFRRMFQIFHLFSDVCCVLLHLDASKLDRVLYLPPRLSAFSPWCQAREGEGGPTCLRAGAIDEMWVDRCGTRDEEQRREHPTGGLRLDV